MKLIEAVILLLVIAVIVFAISWFFSEYIAKHLNIPFIIVFLIGIFCFPLWLLMLLLALFINKSKPPYPYPPPPYPYPPRAV